MTEQLQTKEHHAFFLNSLESRITPFDFFRFLINPMQCYFSHEPSTSFKTSNILFESVVDIVWRVLELQMEETAS
jgi:hypothetical protein